MAIVIRAVKRNNGERYEVDFGIVDGHRRRPLVNTREEAEAIVEKYNKDVKKAGEFWANMPDTERLSTVAVITQIREAKKTIGGVWEDWKRWKSENPNTAVVPCAYEDAVAEFQRRKLASGKTSRYVHNTGNFLMKFGAGRERQNIHEIPVGDLEEWLDGQAKVAAWSDTTKHTYMQLFSSLWTVSISKGWCTLNIVDRLEPVQRIAHDVHICPTDQVRNILAAAWSDPLTQRIIAPLTLGAHGCMRPEEIDSSRAIREGLPPETYFGWHDIDLEHGRITVRREIAKNCDVRVVRMQPTCVEWMKLAKRLKNPLPPVNERKLTDACCAIIGLGEWLRDGLRKTCTTHLRAVYKNDYDVIRDCGNSIRVMLGHYAELNTPEKVSLAYWRETSVAAVRRFMKTPEWEKLLREASAAKPALSPSETSKS